MLIVQQCPFDDAAADKAILFQCAGPSLPYALYPAVQRTGEQCHVGVGREGQFSTSSIHGP